MPPSPSFTPVREVSLPAADPLVLAAGGTSRAASHKTGAYRGETAWGPPAAGASGGGFSRLFARPGYQDGIPGTGAARGVPGVAARQSAAIPPRPAGIRSPGWAAPTPACSSPCSPATPAGESPARPGDERPPVAQ